MTVWLNGEVMADSAAMVSAFDHGLTVGDGVFETLMVIDDQPFAMTRHLQRLAASARGLGLPEPDDGVLRRACADVLAADAVERAASGHPLARRRLRITLTGGPGPLGSARGDQGTTLLVAVSAAGTWPLTARAVTVPWPRNERSAVTGLKTTSYAENVIALDRARSQGASEALCADTQGRLCEGTGSNVFVVVSGELLTPTLATGCLAGVTRALVIEWCSAREVDLPVEVLARADEVFLTSSTRDVQGCHDVDGRLFDAPGPVTRRCAEQFRQRQAESIDP